MHRVSVCLSKSDVFTTYGGSGTSSSSSSGSGGGTSETISILRPMGVSASW